MPEDGSQTLSAETPRSGEVLSLIEGGLERNCDRRRRRSFRYIAATRKILIRHKWIHNVPLAPSLIRTFGFYSVSMFALVYFFSKGIAAHLLTATTLPLFKDFLGLEAAAYQKIVSVGVTAWSMKPLIGVATDTIALGGYHKRWVLTGSSLVCAVMFLAMACLPGGNPAPLSVVAIAGMMLFGANFCCALLDLLPEAMYSELIAQFPESGSAMVSWVWSFVMIGGAVAAILQGPLSDAGHTSGSLLIGFVAQLIIVIPLANNWFCERCIVSRNVTPAGRRRIPLVCWKGDVVRSHPALVAFCLTMACCSMSLAFVTMFLSRESLLLVLLGVMMILGPFSLRVLPPVAAWANLFMFLKELLYIQLPGPMDYVYTASEACVPGGPHFSYSYYQTFTVIVGYAAGMGGVALFHAFFARRGMRFTFWMTTTIKICASLVDIVIIKRWNVQYLGLSDSWSYFLGDAIVFGACQMLDFMPAVILTSRLCPRGLEATMYAVLAGFSNLGQAMSNIIGALLVEFVWPIQAKEPNCNFENLPMLVLFGHCLLPLLILPLTMWMLPAVTLDASLEPEEPQEASANGSRVELEMDDM